jgi:hypothetical protein
MASISPGSGLTAGHVQYKIHDKSITKDGIEYAVEIRENRKRRTEWISADEIDPHLIRCYEAKCRTERLQQKDIRETISSRKSQTIFIESDVDDDDDNEDDCVSVITLSDCSGGSDMIAAPLTHRSQQPAARLSDNVSEHESVRRSSRKRCFNAKYNTEMFSLSYGAAGAACSNNMHALQSDPSPSPLEDHSYHFLTVSSHRSHNMTVTPVPDADGRKKRSNSTNHKLKAASQIRESCSSPQKDSEIRTSARIRKRKMTTSDLQPHGAVSPSTVSGLIQNVFKSNPSDKPDSDQSAKRTRKRSVKAAAVSRSLTSNASNFPSTCVSTNGNSSVTSVRAVRPDSDELGLIDLIHEENHVHQQPANGENCLLAESDASPASEKSVSVPKVRKRAKAASETPVKVVRETTTKRGRKSVSKMEDESFIYDVNAIEKEDADIQRKTRSEESRIRKRQSKQSEVSLMDFYLSKGCSSSEKPVTESSEVRRKLSFTTPSVTRPVVRNDNDMENRVKQLKEQGAHPVTIMGKMSGKYMMEFSNSKIMPISIPILEKYFPDKHQELIAKDADRIRPFTPAYSQLRSPCPSVYSMSTPRTPNAIRSPYYSSPLSPSSQSSGSGSNLVSESLVNQRRQSHNSLMSDIADLSDEDELCLLTNNTSGTSKSGKEPDEPQQLTNSHEIVPETSVICMKVAADVPCDESIRFSGGENPASARQEENSFTEAAIGPGDGDTGPPSTCMIHEFEEVQQLKKEDDDWSDFANRVANAESAVILLNGVDASNVI